MTRQQLDERKKLLEAKKKYKDKVVSKIVRGKLLILTELQNKKRERESRKSDDSPNKTRHLAKQQRTTRSGSRGEKDPHNDSAVISTENETSSLYSNHSF